MADKRTRGSHGADLWDYRHAKTLLDVLAISETREHLVTNLDALCHSWRVLPHLFREGNITKMDTHKTIQNLAKHCLEHGRNQVKERQETDE